MLHQLFFSTMRRCCHCVCLCKKNYSVGFGFKGQIRNLDWYGNVAMNKISSAVIRNGKTAMCFRGQYLGHF